MQKMLKLFFSTAVLNLFFSNVARADVLIVTAPVIVRESTGLSWVNMCIIILVFILLMKSFIFFIFGARRLINYLYLVIANVFSFLIWVILLPRGGEALMIVYFFLANIIGFFVEYFILRLFLKSHYFKRDILKFVLISDVVSIICQIIIFYFMIK